MAEMKKRTVDSKPRQSKYGMCCNASNATSTDPCRESDCEWHVPRALLSAGVLTFQKCLNLVMTNEGENKNEINDCTSRNTE